MTNTLEQAGNELAGVSLDVVKWLRDVVPQTKDFVVEQAPAVIQEIVTRAIALSSVGLFFGVVAITISILAIKVLIKARETRLSEEDSYDRRHVSDMEGGMYGLSIPAFITGMALTAANSYKLIYVLSAPKLYILEYLRNIM